MPTVTFGDNTTDDFAGCEDSQIREDNPDNNWGVGVELGTINFIAGDTTRSFIRFTGLGNIPAGATITAVTLYLWLAAANSGSRTIAWRRTLRAWTEGTEDNNPGDVSWNQYSSGNNWGTAGASNATDRESTISAQAVIGTTTGQYYAFTGAQLTQDIQNKVDGLISDVAYTGTDEGTADEEYRVWSSSEDTNGQRPYLEVTYEVAAAPTPVRRGIAFQQRY